MYTAFNNFIFRTTVLPSNAILSEIKNTSVFKEAIYLASKDFYNTIYNQDSTSKTSSKTHYTLSKYFNRMTTRCTPFGIFAGVGIGTIAQESIIKFKKPTPFRTYTRLDMEYIYSISQYLAIKYRKDLLYFPNTTLYKVFDRFRYVEYSIQMSKRKYRLSEIDISKYITDILSVIEKGMEYGNIDTLIRSWGFTDTESLDFLNELIDNQIIVSEFELSLTNQDILQSLISKIEQLDPTSEMVKYLSTTQSQLKRIDEQKIGRDINGYLDIENTLSEIGIGYDKKNIFQSDTFIEAQSASLDETLSASIVNLLPILDKLTCNIENQSLNRFKDEFYKRYENEEVPLTTVLDPDIGLGFGVKVPGNISINSVIENLNFLDSSSFLPATNNNQALENFLITKYHSFLENHTSEILLEEEEIKSLHVTKAMKLPATIYALFEIHKDVKDDNDIIISMGACGGSSAGNLISRFGHLDKGIGKLIQEIKDKEKTFLENDNTILAEIIHLPEDRVGNVLLRPATYDYEIPYLAKSSFGSQQIIPITDLWVSLKGDRKIVLRSKRLNKYVIPRLTSAHHFSNDSLPIYHFLCMLQFQDTKSQIGFSWGNYFKNIEFLPRVRFKNVILSQATWKITELDIKGIIDESNDQYVIWAKNLKLKKNIPDKVVLVQGDNKMLIDFTDQHSLILLKSLTKELPFQLEEYLFGQYDSFIKDGTKNYNNQIIMAFYKSP